MHNTVGRAAFIFCFYGPLHGLFCFWGSHMKFEREECCCFTGHRRMPPQALPAVRERLRAEIAHLAEKGVTTFLAGGALGFDTIAAQEVLRARESLFSHLRLVLVLPCLGQEKRWSGRDIALYHMLLHQADEVIYTAETYDKECMFRRNRFMADHSAWCLCYLKESRGGTAYTVRYARRLGLTVINLAEPDEEDQFSFFPVE